jgi:hypothetical protein
MFIRRQNIVHYRSLLESGSLDEAERRPIARLLSGGRKSRLRVKRRAMRSLVKKAGTLCDDVQTPNPTSPRIRAIGRLQRTFALPQRRSLAAAAGPGCRSAFHVGAMRLNQRVANLAVVLYQCIQPIQPTGVARLGALALQCCHSRCVQLTIGDVALSPELYPRGHES